MYKVSNRLGTPDVVLVFLLLTLNIFSPFFSASIVDFEQINVSWVSTTNTYIFLKLKDAALNGVSR